LNGTEPSNAFSIFMVKDTTRLVLAAPYDGICCKHSITALYNDKTLSDLLQVKKDVMRTEDLPVKIRDYYDQNLLTSLSVSLIMPAVKITDQT
jgi:hypothetical protein